MRLRQRWAARCRLLNISLMITLSGACVTLSLRKRVMCRRRFTLVCTRLNCLTWSLLIGTRRIAWKRVAVSPFGGCRGRRSCSTSSCLLRNTWLACRPLIGPFVSTLLFMTGTVVIACRHGRSALRALPLRCGWRVVVMSLFSVTIGLITTPLRCLLLMSSRGPIHDPGSLLYDPCRGRLPPPDPSDRSTGPTWPSLDVAS